MRILVTGASGFIGFHLINKLLKNHEVYGIDSYSDNYDISLKGKDIKRQLSLIISF